MFEKEANGIFVIFTAHVTNNGNKRRSLDSLGQKLILGDKEYTADSFADVGSSDLKTSVDPEPGFSDDISFVFDVPTSLVTDANGESHWNEKAVLKLSTLDFDAPDPHSIEAIYAH